ncbi:MAG: acetolactate synthase, large subunit, biosynthetic type [Nitrospina sp.]|jgi:acetolactate synthase-1/2/3 large subunit|nr:acetolactate synthase, large subunit, biosynthetic type [Nitrospina sp.]|tara:strand:- start:1776 stop:3584 length:1809 start_codon:yes stop_codon:yes gene_type:complete
MTTKNKVATKSKKSSSKKLFPIKGSIKNSGRPMKGRDVLVKALENEGVKVIFGYPGGASMEIHQGLTLTKKIRMVLPRHEQGGSFAAGGYARSTGEVGVCLATSGPGATNMVTGIIDAKMDSIPLVAITGQVPSSVLGSDAFQETDIIGATFPLVKHSYMIQSVEEIPQVINEAFHIASTGRPGPVLVDIPKDIQQQEGIVDFDVSFDCPSYRPNLKPSALQCKKAAHAIRTSKRPIIYAGGGIISSRASKELRAFVKKTGIPVTTTLMGLGAFPSNDPLSLRMLGMHGAVYANIAINHADLVIAMGVRFDDRVTGKLAEFCKDAEFIHIDIDPSEINKNILVDIPIQGDVKETLKILQGYVEPKKDIKPWIKQLQDWKKEFPLSFELKKGEIVPQSVVSNINKLASKDAIFSVGVGQHQMWAAQFLDFDEPQNWMCSSGLGAMGYGLSAAMGAQVAFPKRQVINIEGDGSFLMNIQELQTLKVENIPVKNVILNNAHLGMVAQWEDRFYKSMRGHTFIGDANFAEIAHAFGVKSESIADPKDVIPALKRMLKHNGPYVLDVKYPYNDKSHGHVMPMIPGNHTYLDTCLDESTTLRDYWKED